MKLTPLAALGAVGCIFTVNNSFVEVIPHAPPDVVSVKVTGLPETADAVYLVFKFVLPSGNDPPAAPSDQTPPVAVPPTPPPKAVVVAYLANCARC